ncbi:hypothetical protein [Alicyclobacillus vulcanalis]|uniref:Uncharacterized protein n=1 Tax=Alicyclobacillus vulcanalis TaxID=252246 RepID=A0A1N7MQN6_9BACL|nr:hypothetical protein [Alicyclobacillus vulcanalis]SIS88382.1 hypothetical protein SAMN05421799_10633 [Alicyclobacillus vulcanalis]
MFLKIEIDDQVTERIQFMADTVGNVMQDLVEQTAETLTPFLKQNAPVGQHYRFDGTMLPGGQLRDSLRFEIGMYGARLLGAKQGIYVIGGTRPHPIFPRRAKALAFFWPKVGHGVVFGRVNHPGTKPNDFREAALQQAVDEMALQQVFERVINGWITGSGV